ncbi:NLI interacting factor-like phosphatase, putative [Bodo saltans]|uniref:NLI interacting factor-like phosphatase, putative n=1 Tax=Bodo saltans TaxID=75058 RepID=A0A0S4IPI9_BODSA|nr:NLI interacting factor-like phosphatase, putative [Bodo saltans]|eukprot:CUE68303.1 NLI interacting factor-like phosphatase, putative [Bodo saltans]
MFYRPSTPTKTSSSTSTIQRSSPHMYQRYTTAAGAPSSENQYPSSTQSTCYIPAGLQRPASRSTFSAMNGGAVPPPSSPTTIARGNCDVYNAPPLQQQQQQQTTQKMSSQISYCAAPSSSSSQPSTPVKRTPLGDATFITQAARSTPTSSAASSLSATPLKQYKALHQYSPVKAPATPSRQPTVASANTPTSASASHRSLLRSHPLQHHRPLLVLDLDETLVHASVEHSDGNHDVAFIVEMNQQKINVFVKVRPMAREFLRRAATLFEVCVFTASLSPYADRVVDYLDPSGQLVHHRLYREHCTNVDGNYVKDMSLMGRSMERVAIVDNSPIAYTFQPLNAIPILSWFDDKADRELMEMMPMLECFAQTCDFYHTARKFNIKA